MTFDAQKVINYCADAKPVLVQPHFAMIEVKPGAKACATFNGYPQYVAITNNYIRMYEHDYYGLVIVRTLATVSGGRANRVENFLVNAKAVTVDDYYFGPAIDIADLDGDLIPSIMLEEPVYLYEHFTDHYADLMKESPAQFQYEWEKAKAIPHNFVLDQTGLHF